MDLFSVADDYGAWDVLRSAEKKKFGGTFGGLCPLIGCIFFLTDFVRRRNSTTQIVYLTSAEKKNFSAELLEASPPWSLAIFFTDYGFFGFRRNSTTQIMHLRSADFFFSAELSIQTYVSAELNITKCVVDFCWFNGFP